MSKKGDFDFLDDVFNKLNDDTYINTTISDFDSLVKNTINDGVKRTGYDSVPDLVQSEMIDRLTGKNINKAPNATFDDVHMEQINTLDFNSRYDFVMQQFHNFEYENSFRGYYKEGHKAAINRYLNSISLNKDDLCKVLVFVNKEIKDFEQPKKNKKYYQGYMDGLKFIKKCIEKSKVVMMDKISLVIDKNLKVI